MSSNFDSIIEQSIKNREFELKVSNLVKSGDITCPVYLSLGQEWIPATLKYVLDNKGLTLGEDYYLFPSHRNHSIYLSFTQDYDGLLKELTGGYSGSASVGIPNKILSHDGYLGSNIPIGTGFAEAKGKLCIICGGDASFEEDYALGALGWAITKCLPVLYLCIDNGLSILSPKSVRRSWDIVKVAKSMGLYAEDVGGMEDLEFSLRKGLDRLPRLLNITCTRNCWHVGPNLEKGPDYLEELISKYNLEYLYKSMISSFIGQS